MHIIYLIRNFQLRNCGLSDYINKLRELKFNEETRIILLHSNKIENICCDFKFVKWSFFEIINNIRKIKDKKIFFFQFSPFQNSKSGFSLRLIFIFVFLRFIIKDIKIIINFHETANVFNSQIKYFFIYFLHVIQLYALFFLSHKVFYTNRSFIERFTVFGFSKSKYVEIFSNIKNYFPFNEKKKIIIFFNSHFNKKNYNKIFYTLKKKKIDNFKLYFIGNCIKLNILETKKLLLKHSLIANSNFLIDLSDKELSKLLSSSIFVFASRSGKYESNSGFHKAALLHGNYIIEIEEKYFTIYNELNSKYSIGEVDDLLNKYSNKKNLNKNYIENNKRTLISLRSFLV